MLLQIDKTDITDIAGNIKYESKWNNGAGKLTFEYPCTAAGRFANGSVVTFIYSSEKIFYGWLFESEQNKKKYQCTSYDQLRYFKSENSLMRPVGTLTDWLNTVAGTIGNRIRLGTVDKTEVSLSKYLFDNKTYLDMMYDSIQDNVIANGYYYTLRDNFGALDLRDTYDLRLPIVIGDGSLASDFDYTNSIDKDTYNYIKVAKDDSDAGVRNVYIAQDSNTIGTDTTGWGKLMLYDKVSADLNDAQLQARAKRLLQIKNRETESLSVDCMGDTRVFGGSGVKVEISEAALNLWAVVDTVKHEFCETKHTMTLDLKFGRNGIWI